MFDLFSKLSHAHCATGIRRICSTLAHRRSPGRHEREGLALQTQLREVVEQGLLGLFQERLQVALVLVEAVVDRSDELVG